MVKHDSEQKTDIPVGGLCPCCENRVRQMSAKRQYCDICGQYYGVDDIATIAAHRNWRFWVWVATIVLLALITIMIF